MQARDFYDIWYILEVHGMDVGFYVNEFRSKCENKGLNANNFYKKIVQRLPQYKGRWQTSMKNQIKDLPNFDRVERETMRHLRNLEL